MTVLLLCAVLVLTVLAALLLPFLLFLLITLPVAINKVLCGVMCPKSHNNSRISPPTYRHPRGSRASYQHQPFPALKRQRCAVNIHQGTAQAKGECVHVIYHIFAAASPPSTAVHYRSNLSIPPSSVPPLLASSTSLAYSQCPPNHHCDVDSCRFP